MIELTIKSAKPSFVDELMLMDEDDKHLHSQKYKNDRPNSPTISTSGKDNKNKDEEKLDKLYGKDGNKSPMSVIDSYDSEALSSDDRVEAWELLQDQGDAVFASAQKEAMNAIFDIVGGGFDPNEYHDDSDDDGKDDFSINDGENAGVGAGAGALPLSQDTSNKKKKKNKKKNEKRKEIKREMN